MGFDKVKHFLKHHNSRSILVRQWAYRCFTIFVSFILILVSTGSVEALSVANREKYIMNDIVFYDPDGCDPSSVASSATSSYIGGTLSGTGDYTNVLNAKNADKYLFNGSGNIDTAHWSDGDNSSMKRLLENYGDLAYQLGKTVGIPYIALLVQMRYEDPTSQCGANNFWGNGCPPGTLPGGASIQGKNLGEGFMQYGKTLLEYNGGEFYKPAIGISDPKLYLETLGPLWVNGDPNGAGYSTIEDEKNSIDELTEYINSAEGQAIVKTFGNYSASDGVNAGNAAGGSSLNTSGTISVSSSGSAVNYKGDIILTTDQIDVINGYQPVYEEAVKDYNIPWQMLAAVHYRENSLTLNYNSNGQGIFQLYDEAQAGQTYPTSGKASQAEFLEQAKITAKHLSDGMVSSGKTPGSDEAVKFAFFAYNGRAQVYINQAINLGFSVEEAKIGEGSPYVMNRYDAQRDPTDAAVRASGKWGQILVDGGALGTANEEFGAFVVYSALKGTGWSSTGGINSNPCFSSTSGNLSGNGGALVAQIAIKLAWPDDQHYYEINPEYAEAAKKYSDTADYATSLSLAQDCGHFVAVVVREAVDKNYPPGYTPELEKYMSNSDSWQEVPNLGNESNLQPGDVFVVNEGSHGEGSKEYPSGGAGAYGHVYIYLGNGKTASAGLGWHTGDTAQGVSYEETYNGVGYKYRIFRSTINTGIGTTGSFDEELKALEIGKKVGVAVTAPGNKDASKVQTGGSWAGGRAWSTIKVPLAIAATQKSASAGTVTDPYGGTCTHGLSSAINVAITQSDNCGAWWLWQALGGDGSDAASAVTNVINSGGDSSTTVTGTRASGESALTSGKTTWSLVGQAIFAANMASLSGSSSTLTAMKNQSGGDSSFGLNTFSSAMSKGGWGNASGTSATRQFGIIKLDNGKCSAVAIGTDAGSSFSTLNDIAKVLKNHQNDLPSGTCPGGL